MSRFHSYVKSSARLVSAYNGREPFALFAKKFFFADKKYGSKDRKRISHLCYCFFRLGGSPGTEDIETKILAGLFLCSVDRDDLIEELRPDWVADVGKSPERKIEILRASGIDIELNSVFPDVPLSEGIDRGELIRSHFVQPDLFIRIRPGFESLVLTKLNAASISYEAISEHSIALPNTTRLNDILETDREAVIQDFNSQRVWEYIPAMEGKCEVWDCCAASGGKSFLVADKIPTASLTVSDIRKSILINLEGRFRRGGIKNYRLFQKDLLQPEGIPGEKFDLVVADVPCTGSGTWSRTPEQLYFFDPGSLSRLVDIQRGICRNIINAVKSQGYLLYITCSVFRQENEDNVQHLSSAYGLDILKQGVLHGYDKKADTLFATLLKRS